VQWPPWDYYTLSLRLHRTTFAMYYQCLFHMFPNSIERVTQVMEKVEPWSDDRELDCLVVQAVVHLVARHLVSRRPINHSGGISGISIPRAAGQSRHAWPQLPHGGDHARREQLPQPPAHPHLALTVRHSFTLSRAVSSRLSVSGKRPTCKRAAPRFAQRRFQKPRESGIS
jgi:hypothetical protein